MADTTLCDLVIPDDRVPTPPMEEYIDFKLYEIVDNIGVPPGLDIAVFFPGHDCPHVNLVMPEDVPIGGCIRIRIPSDEPVLAEVHRVNIQRVTDLPYTSDRTVAEAFFVDCPELVAARKTANFMKEYRCNPFGGDVFMHKLNTLSEFFTFINNTKYKNALKSDKLGMVLHMLLHMCPEYRSDLQRLIKTHTGENDQHMNDVIQQIKSFEESFKN